MTTLQPGTVVSDRFEILQPLAPAGAGRLYRVKDRQADGKTITLEVIDRPVEALDPKAVEEFVKDASTAAEVPHEGIAKVIAAGSDSTGGLLWVAMEPIDGETLRDRLNRGPISPRETLGIVQRILDVLAAAHARGAVHRGLTPEDVVLVRRADGTEGVELLDFGFARHLAAPPSSPYVSPEQARASSWVTPAADVFSLGAIFYEMVTGRAPHDPPQPIRELAPSTPPPIATLIEKSLKSDPADRPIDAGAVKTQLQNILAPPPPPPQAQPFGPPGYSGPYAAGGAPPRPYNPYAPSPAGAAPPAVMSGPAPEPRKSGGWGWIIALIALAGVCLITPVILVFVGMFAAIKEANDIAPYDPYAYPSPTPYDPNQGTSPGPFLPDPLPSPSAVERYNVPVTSAQPQRGPSDALVTIVMFSDFQCPFCARVEDTLDRIVELYPRDVRIVWRNNPLAFHQDAEPAAQMAMEAHAQGGNDAFWRVHDLLFANNRALAREDLLRYATQAGLDRGRVRRAIEEHAHTLTIASDQALASQLGADGTPSFFINGRPLVGAQPFESFQAIIDEEIRTANERVNGGVPREQIYDTLVRDAPTSEGGTDPLGAFGPPGGGGLGLGEDDGAVGDGDGAPEDQDYTLAVPPDAPTKGRAGARVTIHLVSDFQCPFCNRVRPTVDRIMREHRNVRLVWRDYPLPFHTEAMPAAEAAREARAQGGDRKFWQMHDLLFDNQHALSRADLERYAQQIGLDMNRFRRALDEHTHEAAIRADMAAIDATGASLGTPSFFINGRLLQGAQPYESFDAAIERALVAP